MAANERDALKYIPIVGKGVDALERRKEHNNNQQVTASSLSESIAKVKTQLFAGLSALASYKVARR